MIWGYLCILVAIWGLGGIKFSIAKTLTAAYLGWQIANIGSIVIPVVYSHFVFEFLKIKRNRILIFFYIIALFLLVVEFFKKEWFLGDLIFVFDQFYTIDWTINKSILYILFYIGFYWILLSYVFYYLFINFIKSTGLKHNQLKYFMLGTMGAFLGAHSFFLLPFGIYVYPYLDILIGVYPIIIGYSIVRHRLMDITVVLTRTTIFIAVYSIVLGLPFLLAFGWQEKLISLFGNNWWLGPLITSTVLATAGPFIYLFVDKKAEAKIFEEQLRYQNTLRQASSGMGRIKDLAVLLNFIKKLIIETVKVRSCRVYIRDAGHYKETGGEEIPDEGSLIKELKENRKILITEEIRHLQEDQSRSGAAAILENLESLRASIVVPSFVEEDLIAVIVIGEKLSGKIYTAEDLVVFAVLAGHAALAIENAQYLDDIKKTHEKLLQTEKLAYVGQLASSIVHEVRNPLTAIETYIAYLPKKYNDPQFREKFNQLVPREIGRIKNITNQLLDLAKQKKIAKRNINLTACVESALELLETHMEVKKIKVIREYENENMPVRGDEDALRQVFVNLFLNAIQAIDADGSISINCSVHGVRCTGYEEPKGSPHNVTRTPHTVISIKDTGCGMSEEQLSKLFIPFETSKKEGIGLGMVITKEIIELHGGTILAESREGGGTKLTIDLPIEDKD